MGSKDPFSCAGPEGKTAIYQGACIPNLFSWNSQQQSASSNKEGMICPGLTINRPDSVTNLSAAYYNNVVSTDPLLFCYQGCRCASPFVSFYYVDKSGSCHCWFFDLIAGHCTWKCWCLKCLVCSTFLCESRSSFICAACQTCHFMVVT